MKQYDTYLFDLYGTLVDIHTDEYSMRLWNRLAAMFRTYGLDYSGASLKENYFRICEEENIILAKADEDGEAHSGEAHSGEAHSGEAGDRHPEIEIRRVYAGLILDKQGTDFFRHKMSSCPDMKALLPHLAKDKKVSIETLMYDPLIYVLANEFRVISRSKLKIYPHTEKTLKALKERGAKLYLLSNAQEVFTMPEIMECGIDRLLDKMWISSDKAAKKPDERFIRDIIRTLDIDISSCVMVGNEVACDVGVAATVGMDSVLLNTGKKTAKEISREFAKIKKKYPGAVKPAVIDSIKELL